MKYTAGWYQNEFKAQGLSCRGRRRPCGSSGPRRPPRSGQQGRRCLHIATMAARAGDRLDAGTRFRFGGMAPPERVPNL